MTEIVGYTYRAADHCPSCIVVTLIQTPLPLSPAAADMGAEPLLDQLAAYLGVDRDDETSFDSGDFPKVVREEFVTINDTCDGCGRNLVESYSPCPACGNPVDYCDGHGVSRDVIGWSTLNQHDAGDHECCHEAAGCAS
jgi:rRNA maturation protein Nop10